LTKIFKNKNKILFVSKADRVLQRGSYSVILSPEFYWVKKVKLPVKKERDALKLAPSLYEGFLPEGDYSYEVRKEGDDFIVLAYDKKRVSEALDEIFLHKKDIAEIYFAQDALRSVQECVAVNANAALSNMDSVIIQVPRACTNTEKTLYNALDDAVLGKRKVKLSSFDNRLLSSGDLKIIALIVGMLLVAFVSEYIVYKKALSDLDTKRMQIITEHDLPRTSIQLKSIKKSLFKKFETQKAMRELLFTLSKITLKKGEYIESIEESNKEMLVKIHVLSKQREDEIKKMFPANISIKESKINENSLLLRIAL
jgi:hypothetical protein